ncbi:MAG: SUMF1/EgtB/PvdO family nonheme iron enzyme, partial [Gammaproteobacteria bacterium]
ALLQRAARGDFTAPEEPTATRPRRPKEAASAPPPAAVEAPAAESKSTQTRPRATQAKPAPAVEKAGPAGAKPPKKGSISPWLGAAVVGALAIAAFVFLRPASAPESDAGPGAPAAVIVDEPGRELVEAYLDADDWSPGEIRRLTRDWNDLPYNDRNDVKSTSWFRELAREVRDQLRLTQVSGASSPTTVALEQLAESLQLRIDARPEVAVAQAPVAAPPPAAKSTTPAPKEVPDPVKPDVTSVVAEPAATKSEPPVVVAPAQVVTPEPEVVTATPAVPEPVAPSAEPTSPPASTNNAASPANQCDERALNTRRKFCRDTLPNGELGPRLALVRPATYRIGSNDNAEEQPVHDVTLAVPFGIAVNEVSVAQYAAFCTATGGRCPADPWGNESFPAVNVSWYEAQAYAQWWSEQTGQTYRLPTEAEWEIAARANTTSKYPFGDEVSYLQAHFSETDRKQEPIAVDGELVVANGFGLKHIVGNAAEWTADAWHDDYSSAPTDGTARTQGGSDRVVRGGSYRDRAPALRSAARDKLDANQSAPYVGFRLVREIGRGADLAE